MTDIPRIPVTDTQYELVGRYRALESRAKSALAWIARDADTVSARIEKRDKVWGSEAKSVASQAAELVEATSQMEVLRDLAALQFTDMSDFWALLTYEALPVAVEEK